MMRVRGWLAGLCSKRESTLEDGEGTNRPLAVRKVSTFARLALDVGFITIVRGLPWRLWLPWRLSEGWGRERFPVRLVEGLFKKHPPGGMNDASARLACRSLLET
jgi:hypothetical protein